MAWQTPKTNWAAGDGVANGDLNRIEENVRMLSQSAGAFGTCTGSANAYSVTASPPLTSLSEGACVAVKINVTNTAGSTINVNGLGAKAIKKGNGLDVAAGQLKAGSIYTLRYNGVNFTLQGEGGSGNATASDLLSGKTASVDAGDIVGTMPDRSGDTAALSVYRDGTTLKLRASDGYRGGVSYVTHTDANDVAGNIKHNVAIRGVTGNFTSDATATAADILSGSTAYAKGVKLTGTGKRIATGTGSLVQVSTTSAKLTVTGLPFTPSKIYLKGSVRARYTDSVYPEGSSANYMTVSYAIYENEIVPQNRFSDTYIVMPVMGDYTYKNSTITITASITFQTGGFTVVFNQTSPDNRGLDQYGTQSWVAVE